MLVKTSTTILATLPMMRGRLRAELSLPKTGGADGLTVTLDDTGVGMDGLTVTRDDTGVGMVGLTVTLEVEAGVGMDGLTVTLEVEAGVGGELTVMLDDNGVKVDELTIMLIGDGVDVNKLTAILGVDWVVVTTVGVNMDRCAPKLVGEAGMDSGRLLLTIGATEVDAELLVRADPALSEAWMLLLVTMLGLGTTELVLSLCTGVGLGLSAAAEDEDGPVSAVLVIEDDD